MKHTSDDEYAYEPSFFMMGYASTLPVEDEAEDVIRLLHQVVREVTGKEVEAPAKPRMGFLP